MSARDIRLTEARLAATAAAVSGRAGTLYHLVSGLMGEGVPLESILFDVLVPTEADLGTRWQSGDYLVSEEHAATASVETVVALLAGSFDQPREGPHVVVAAAEGDQHSLPGRLVAAYLVFLGYRTTYLGANVLASDLAEYLDVERPDVVVLSCAMTNHLLGARAAIRAAHAAGLPVIAGGSGFGPAGEWAAVLGADAWVPDPRDVSDLLTSWEPDPASREARAVEPSEELMDLVERRLSVLAAAQAHLGASGSGDGGRRAVDETSLLLGAVEASMLVGDHRVIVDMVDWQKRTLGAQGYDLSRSIVEALRVALGRHAPAAGAVFSRALTACAE